MNENTPENAAAEFDQEPVAQVEQGQCPLSSFQPKILEQLVPLVNQIKHAVPTSAELRSMTAEQLEAQHVNRMRLADEMLAWSNQAQELLKDMQPEEPRKVYAQSQAGIEEMRADGCDPQEIQKAEARLAYHDRGLLLLEPVRQAFAGVKLGNGVGLLAGQGMDDYEEDPEVWARYKREDEREDWTRLTAEAINRCGSSFSFFDAEGMRFHLPAFITMELTEGLGMGMDILLTGLDDDQHRAPFALLNEAQRSVVRCMLYHLLEDPDWLYSDEALPMPGMENCWARNKEIRKALAGYWALPAPEPPPPETGENR